MATASNPPFDFTRPNVTIAADDSGRTYVATYGARNSAAQARRMAAYLIAAAALVDSPDDTPFNEYLTPAYQTLLGEFLALTEIRDND